MNTPASLKSVMSARFRRHSYGPVPTATALFDELPPAMTSSLFAKVALLEGEMPVLASVFSSDDWLLSTTHRVVVSRDGRVASIMNNDLKDASFDGEMCIKERQTDAFQQAYILLETFSGIRHSVHIQSGGGYNAIISVLKMLAERNWREKKKSDE